MNLPPTSLIICSRNRPDMLAEAVESVLQGTELPTELIIIDQSTTEHPTLKALKTDSSCEIRYLWTQSVGLSRANNIGITIARYDLLAFIHDDVLITPTWFGKLIRALLEAGPGSVVTGQVPPSEPERPGGFQQTIRVDEAPAVYEGRTYAYPLLVLNMAIYRSAIDEVGGFDERLGPGTAFPGAEDVDLGFRLLEAGYRIIYAPDAILYHRTWRTKRDYLPLRWDYGFALGAFYAKHLSLQDSWMLLRMLGEIKHRIFKSCRSVWFEPRQACGDLVSVFGILSGSIRWMLTKRQ